MNIYEFIGKLARGGSIVSVSSCTPEQIAQARASGNVWSDAEGMTFIYLSAASKAASGSAVGFGSGLSK